MKPGHIRVFDGLRITAEHLDHLQQGTHSTVGDLRELLGLGHVQAGLEVEKSGPEQVTIRPGLAFDWQRNRIACDERQTLGITFPEGESEQVVCVRYRQVEKGLVEGQPTLIFESCEPFLRSGLPAPADNAVALARVVREVGDGEGTFSVALAQPAPTPTETEAAAPAVAIGVARLALPDPATDLAARLREGASVGGEDGIRVRLTQTSIDLSFAPTALSCDAAFEQADGEQGSVRWQAQARGEVLLRRPGAEPVAISQWGVTRVYVHDPTRDPRVVVDEESVATIPLPGPVAGLELQVRVEDSLPAGLRLVLWLVSKGGVDDAMFELLEGQPLRLAVAAMGWKATGSMS